MKGDSHLADSLDAKLVAFDSFHRPLPGIRDEVKRRAFVLQLIDSVHRVRYVEVVRNRPIAERRIDPSDDMFDPIRAAIWYQKNGNIEEAFWLVFLFVHFGKSRSGGWKTIAGIYGRLGQGHFWHWSDVSKDVKGFRKWLEMHQDDVNGLPGFGNHRKFESLNATSEIGTGAVIESYVNWVNPPRTHQELFDEAIHLAHQDSEKAFDMLYDSMRAVLRFGRLARFDYLTMIGKLKLADIKPGSTYMEGASGPFKGAKLLFGASANVRRNTLDAWLRELDAQLKVGMQVLEDALCNWQKSPVDFVRFRG